MRFGVGTNKVEKFEGNQSNLRFGESKGKRDENMLGANMGKKLENCRTWEREKRKERGIGYNRNGVIRSRNRNRIFCT